MKKIVIALGGNALQASNKPATAEAQLETVNATCEYLAEIMQRDYEIAIVHGNGPQIGRILLASETAKDVTPVMPFDVCGAMSQGYIGYHIQQGMLKSLQKRGINRPVASLVTQVVVDKSDPSFQNPTKPIGAFYTKEEADALGLEKGYAMKEDAGRGWRRVVASPIPTRINEIDTVKYLLAGNTVVITCGGGGIPVVEGKDGLEGVAAVIDKDFSAEKLAEEIGADLLVILTEVEKAAINFGKPNQQDLGEISVAEAEKYIAEGHFAAGSMLPKVQAAVKFAKTGKTAIITALDKAIDALEGKTGTVIS